MTKRELRELIKSVIKEYTGTGSGGGNSTDGNSITSPRPFKSDKDEVGDYTRKGAPFGGAEGNHTRGMEKTQAVGNYNIQKQVRF
jgi:hypothetical protein